MESPPKWYMPVAIIALLWNLIGCAAYLADVMLKPADIAKLTAAQQAMYAARPAWSIGATAVAVWFGAAGCVGLIARTRWASPLLMASVAGVIAQDVWLFGMSGAASAGAAAAFILQGLVLAIAVALVMLARKAMARGWIA